MRKFATFAVSNLVILVSLLTGLEWLLWGKFNIEPSIRANDPELFLRARKNLDVAAISPGNFEVRYRTNNLGFRGSSKATLEKNEGTKRILVLGDSFTFGVGVEDHETFSHLLNIKLNENSEYEVFNAGLPDTGTGYQLNYFERQLDQVKPDVLLLAMSENDLNDIHRWRFFSLVNGKLVANDVMKERQSEHRLREYLDNSLYRFLTQYSSLLFLARVKLTVWFNKDWTNSPSRPANLSDDDRLFFTMLEKFKQMTQNSEVAFLPLLIPSKSTVDGKPTYSYGQFRKVCRNLTLNCLSVLTELRQQGGSRKSYFPTDSHLNPLGHQILARKIASRFDI